MNRAQAPAHVLLLAACAWLPACGLNQGGVEPPDDTIAYPASAVLDGNGDWLFVTNSNADLRYNDGTLMALNLKRATCDRTLNDPVNCPHDDWQPCDRVDYDNPRSDPNHPSSHYCCWDRVDNNILNCDERYYVGTFDDATAFANGDRTVRPGRSNVRIGSFAAGMVRQQMQCPAICSTCGADATYDRLLLGVRGDTSLTWIDVTPSTDGVAADTPPVFNCTAPSGYTPPADPFQACDANHRIINTPTMLAAPMEDYRNTQPVPLPDEPYALAIDYDVGVLYIGHLTGATSRPFSGGFSLFDIAPLGAGPVDPPRFIAPFPSPFPPTSFGSVGITTLNVHTNSAGQTLSVLASSRFTPQVSGLGTTANNNCGDANNPVREIAAFPNGINYTSPLGGAETRGIAFIDNEQDPSLSRAFVLQRSPPTLIGFLAANMAPTDLLETCGSPTFLDKPKTSNRLFVTCFADGQIYVYDPEIPALVETFTVGRGPAGLVFDDTHDRNAAYVVGFGDNNISVVDLVPGSRTQYHVIQRIGFPRTSPR